MTRPAVFLDRDGVINRAEVRDGKPYAPRRLQDFRLLPGVPKAVRALREEGFLVVVVTNQPDVGNDLIDPSVIEAMHDRLRARLPIDTIEVCAHRQAEGCDCRKPKPGMLLAAARRLAIDLRRSFVVGDRWHDIVAGRDAGCCTVFVNRGYGERKPDGVDVTARSLPAAVRRIIAMRSRHRLKGGRGG